jgi:hypothetical protein
MVNGEWYQFPTCLDGYCPEGKDREEKKGEKRWEKLADQTRRPNTLEWERKCNKGRQL